MAAAPDAMRHQAILIVAHVATAAVFLAMEVILMFRAMYLGNLILMATNGHLPPERKYSVYGWGFDRWGWHRRLWADYRRFHPDGDLVFQMWVAQGCAFAALSCVPAALYSTPWALA
jgi:hypothetical protein